jgi:hypothetical protein
MKLFGCLIILCLFHTSIIAQKNSDPGFIINQNRDTVKGFIETTEEKDLSGAVYFKKEINDAWKEYHPKDLFGFGIGQELYRSIRFINTINENVKDTVFARLLVAGVYNLFTFVESSRFFLLQKDTSIYLLYDEFQLGSGEIVREGNFRNYLNFISLPCDNLKDEVKNVGYSEKNIGDFVQKTNHCISGESSLVYSHNKQKLLITPIVFAGGLPLSGPNAQFTTNFTLRTTLPRMDKKLSLNIGVNYSSTTYKTAESEALNPDYQYYTKEQIFSIPLTIQYNVLLTRVQPYFYLGFSYGKIQIDNLATGFWVQPNDSYNSFNIVGGLGIEVRVVYGLFVRADLRFESLVKYPVIGISYHF